MQLKSYFSATVPIGNTGCQVPFEVGCSHSRVTRSNPEKIRLHQLGLVVPGRRFKASSPLAPCHFRRFPCKSDSRTLSRLGPGRESVPNKTAPCIDAATAQPTRQSNSWLSLAGGRSFHSSSSRPRPLVFTRYSEVRCSASIRCPPAAASDANNDKQPGSPIGTASRA